MIKLIASFLFTILFTAPQTENLKRLFEDYEKEKTALAIPDYGMDYLENFKQIVSAEKLIACKSFYAKYAALLTKIDRTSLSLTDRINYDHLWYITALEQERFALELRFKETKAPLSDNGLYTLNEHKKWYALYTRIQTSTRMTPEELYNFGEKEVQMVQQHIKAIRKKMGFAGKDEAFAEYLKSDRFYLTDTFTIEELYRKKEQSIRGSLHMLFEDTSIHPLEITTWKNATPMLPPAIYRSNQNRFDYNFSERKHNIRMMDWVLNHEGIPGHHYKFSIQQKNSTTKPAFVQSTFYPGTAEGWACYTEYLGKDLGQYQTPEEELGKWEWDLVRSARVVLDVGIHYYGWTKAQAMDYWKKHIKGQDEIADREITRVTKWPGQALSYKVGAMKIEELKKKLHIDNKTIKKFHSAFLRLAAEPIEVIELNIEEVFNSTH